MVEPGLEQDWNWGLVYGGFNTSSTGHQLKKLALSPSYPGPPYSDWINLVTSFRAKVRARGRRSELRVRRGQLLTLVVW